MSETLLFAVTGRPVLHSLSPQIFNFLFSELKIDATYTRLAAESASEALQTAKSMGLTGLNITSPFKKDAVVLLDELDSRALAADAVNCVVFQKKSSNGHNTDDAGSVGALQAHSINPAGKHVAVFGAGGAARAASYGLLSAGAKKVTLMNRTLDKAQKTALRLGCAFAPLEKAKEVLPQSDIVISCIPRSSEIVNLDFLKKGQVVMDANYKDLRFVEAAREKGCFAISGLDWLLHQALPAFRLFTGKEVPAEIEKKLRNELFHFPAVRKPCAALVGFMGSGKTAIGKLLADKMGWRFIDIDAEIEKSLGRTIQEIFKKEGESFFRKKEKSILKDLLPASRDTVFALGGGAGLDRESCTLVRRSCLTAWLWVSSARALSRIDAATKPMLRRHNPEKRAKALLEQRIPYYARVSDLTINTEIRTPEATARKIKDEMDQAFTD